VHDVHQNILAESCTTGNVQASGLWRCMDMGKSSVEALRHGGFAMITSRAPCHSITCPHAALVSSSSL